MLRWRVREIHSAIVDRYLFPFLSTNIGIMDRFDFGSLAKIRYHNGTICISHSRLIYYCKFCDPSVTYHDSFSLIQSVPSPSPGHLCYGR
jgi:hypothetical protein